MIQQSFLASRQSGYLNGEPYFVRHGGQLNGRMECVRHYISEGWKMSKPFFRGLENVRKVFLGNSHFLRGYKRVKMLVLD